MQDIVQQRDIRVLWHFTRMEVLPAILANGLIPRQTLIDSDQVIAFNDEYRHDGHPDASCLSVSFPNYKMFYPLRRLNDQQIWIVLALHPKVLWEKNCAFCTTNAASASVSSIPIETRIGCEAFRRLFDECPPKPSREQLRLKDSYPTNPQAEVLVFDTIEPGYILGVACDSSRIAEILKHRHPDIDIRYHKFPFGYRHDYEYWR